VPDATAISDTEADPYRLPRIAVPSRYELRLEPDLEAFTFTGTCSTTLDVEHDTDVLVLNAIELELSDAAARRADGASVAADRIDYDATTERVTLHFPSALDAGPWVLDTSFVGQLNDKLHGFYRSTFADADGETQVIATTQFESTDARRAFPCWDEPEYKAVFSISLVVDPELAAISNAAETARTPRGDGKHLVTFADTIAMSTYLVAFVVGPLDLTDPVDVDGTPLRVA